MLKKDLRKKYRIFRNSLTNNQLIELSQQVLFLCKKHFAFEQKTISLFQTMDDHQEILTHYFFDFYQANNTIASPRSNFLKLEMTHLEVKDLDGLVKNEYGIPEPIDGKEIEPNQFDVVFIPLYTVDVNGYRVGYGKGFYDRFLAECKPECLFIGLHLFDTVDTIDDINSHDMPIHYCITPQRILSFGHEK